MLLSRHQNSRKNHDMKIANSLFENMAQFKCLETTVTNNNLIERGRGELRGDLIRVMLAVIQPRTFCLVVCCVKHKT
jgi:hypothetical protein